MKRIKSRHCLLIFIYSQFHDKFINILKNFLDGSEYWTISLWMKKRLVPVGI